PPKMAHLRENLDDLVEEFDSRKSYGSVLLSSRRGLQIQLEGGVEKITQQEPRDGTVITIYDGDTLHERAIHGFDLKKVQLGAQEILGSISPNGGFQLEIGPERFGDFANRTVIAPESLSTQQKLDRCRELRERVKQIDDRILDVRIRYAELREDSVFRAKVADLGQRIDRLLLYLILIVGDTEGKRKYNVTNKSGTFGWEGLSFTQEELEEFVEKTCALLEAERITPGEYDVIASPDVSGVICHESFGHGVETDMFLRERAKAAEYIDQVVASPLVDIYDDPSLPGAMGSYFFDDEGWEASPTRIVGGGVFRRGITELYSATRLNVPRSANGRRQDFSRKAYARMSNTYFAAGDTPVDDLFAQVDDGVYIERFFSGVEDPLGWGIQVTCHFGWEIKNGAKTGRVYSPVGLSGYVPDVLQSISAMGDQLEMSGGGCGKGHKEMIRVSSGGPHMLLKARLG
ncbi:MAG: TldD/PmbA family protein, partial [Anaerolineales bacterium]